MAFGLRPVRGSGTPRLTVEESRAIRERLRSAWLIALAIIVVGIVADAPALIPVGILVGVLGLARELFLRRGVRGFAYQRTVATRHAVWGDRVSITVRIWNRSWLPAAWLTAEDQLSEAVVIRADRPAAPDSPAVPDSPAGAGFATVYALRHGV